MRAVVDTNVPVVANGGDNVHASPQCQLACIERLETLARDGVILVDIHGLILEEYGRKLDFQGQPGMGDAFFRHIHDYMGQSEYVEQIIVTPSNKSKTDFEEFPGDPALAGFDRDDRKFAAVARKGQAPVLNAVDSDWAQYEQLLEQHDIHVEQLCPRDIR